MMKWRCFTALTDTHTQNQQWVVRSHQERNKYLSALNQKLIHSSTRDGTSSNALSSSTIILAINIKKETDKSFVYFVWWNLITADNKNIQCLKKKTFKLHHFSMNFDLVGKKIVFLFFLISARWVKRAIAQICPVSISRNVQHFCF